MAAKRTKAAQVTVDEAVVAKGGKPAFMKEYEDAAGITAGNEKAADAAVHFDRRIVPPHREVIALTKLVPYSNNPRTDLGDVSSLVTSINSNGFLGALTVRELADGTFEVVTGNRRLEAAKKAQLESVPCDIYELTDVQALELNLTEQLNRADLSPIEEGESCRKLMELAGYTPAQAGEKLAKSASWVTKRVALCGLASEVKKSLASGETALTVAQALASLPQQKAQVDALKALKSAPQHEFLSLDADRNTADGQVLWLRERCSRPLAGATWKLTDAELLPAAGACSVCPHNSASAKMPGLFDNAKGKPMCALPSCFEDKLKAAWLAKTAKMAAAGAKILSLAEGKKLFPRADSQLSHGSRYVEADAMVQKDKSKRTWRQLLGDCDVTPEEGLPVLHVACGADGKARELYVEDKALACIATHLKLKWAVEAEEAETVKTERATPEKQKEEQRLREVREAVAEEAKAAIVKKLVANGLTLPDLRTLVAEDTHEADGLHELLGLKMPKDAAKWIASNATFNELMAMLFLENSNDLFNTWQGFDERLPELAKRHGFDVERAVKAKLDAGEKAA